MKTKQNFIRVTIGVFTGMLLLIAGIWIYSFLYLDAFVGGKLKSFVKEQSGDRYQLQYESLQTGFLDRSLSIRNITVEPTDLNSDETRLQLDVMHVSGMRIWRFWRTGNLRIGKVGIKHPHIEINEKKLSSGPGNRLFNVSRVKKHAAEFRIDEIKLTGGLFRILSENGDERGVISGLNVKGSGLYSQSASPANSPVAIRDMEVDSEEVSYNFPNGLYSLEVADSRCSTVDRSCRLSSIRLKPQLPRHSFSRFLGYETDRIDLAIPQLRIINIDLGRLAKQQFIADKMVVDKAKMEVYRDKRFPLMKDKKNFPHIRLRNLGMPVNLDTITVHGSEIQYLERKPDVSQPGRVVFDEVNVSLYGVTNRRDEIGSGHSLRLSVRSKVMQSGVLTLQGTFPMHKKGTHTLTGTLGTMKMNKANPVLEPLKMVRFKSGTIHSMKFDMELGPKRSTGIVQMEYSDLNVELLNNEDLGQSSRREIVSFLANTFKIRSDNRDTTRVGEVSFQRVEHKTIFNYWWKSLASGLQKIVGL